MAKYPCNLTEAVEGQAIVSCQRKPICPFMLVVAGSFLTALLAAKQGKNKLKIAHQLLSSVAFMHAQVPIVLPPSFSLFPQNLSIVSHFSHCVWHQGFMHRDIKGENVMLTDTMEPVLIDLSLAKPVSPLRDHSWVNHAPERLF